MDIFIGRQKQTLHPQRDFVAQGGEGSVYVKNGIAYKIYADPAKMIPPGKIQELAVLDYPGIVRPEEIIRDASGQAVGYTMNAAPPQSFPLCRTFTKSFRENHRLGSAEMLALVRELQKGIAHVHHCGLLIVDLNEMNFLLSADFARLFFIDVDSYQTPHYPATALMETVRDRHSAVFSPGTDWFSFAVVSFQMLVGIHPYKGKHATLKTLDERMMANCSVLNTREVSMPSACQPLSVLPRAYRAWYEAVLDNGERCCPPLLDSPVSRALIAPAAPSQPAPVGGSLLDIQQIGAFDGDILAVLNDIVLTTCAVYHNGRKVRDMPRGAGHDRFHIVRSAGPSSTPFLACTEHGILRLLPTLPQKILVGAELRADAVSSAQGRLYIQQGVNLIEVMLRETPAGILVQPRVIGNVLAQATRLFEGVAFQDLLGACYASLLPRSGTCQQVRLPALDHYQIVDARYEGGVLIVVGVTKSGRYDKYIFRFDSSGAYDARPITDVSDLNVNFTTLDTGVCLHIADNDTLEIFAAKPGSGGQRVLAGSGIGGDARLLQNGAQARFIRGNTLCTFSLRNGGGSSGP